MIHYQALHPEKGDVTRALVESAHQRNQRIHVYTVNGATEMQRLVEMGIDGIFTDDPVLARQNLKVAG
jgi:glycerophosphoryl diester phosphodiesterase